MAVVHELHGIDTAAALTLHEYLRRTVYVRREKSDLGEGVLPHSGWVVAPLALPDGTMRRYQRVEHDFFNLCAEERGKVWADKVSRAQAIVQMGMLREEAGRRQGRGRCRLHRGPRRRGQAGRRVLRPPSRVGEAGLALLGKGHQHRHASTAR